MISLRKLAAATACLALLVAPTMAKDKVAKWRADSMDFAMHDASFSMYHEIGHMLVDAFELPVLGKEEDAVDALATIWLLTDDSDDDSWNALIDAADGWYYNAVKSTGLGIDDLSYSSDHSLDIQRAYAMVCMMVGAVPDVFGDTADNYNIGEDRQEECGYTFAQAYNSWQKLLQPHVVSKKRGAEISVVYEDAGDFEDYARALRKRKILEHAAELVSKQYVLPEPMTFRAKQCGEPNAFYYPGANEVVYCYEMADSMFSLYLYDILGWSGTAN
ncbi:DUF4344 domain-containing metallopeptidase [Devosia soli]|uniref:DUF4344 domain-containing metallopeptidase n=1 Tax=Devosia soli TaxID=361041 RepID=UPI00069AFE91|nr:DUF4344 domain-containing metallopeptidase [Devosia soli]